MMVAETLGVDYARIATTVGDTAQLGYNFITGGSRATYASGMAAVDAAKQVIAQACERAAKIWKLPVDSLEYDAGFVRPTGPNAGTQPPNVAGRDRREIPSHRGPIMGKTTPDAPGAGPEFRHPSGRCRSRSRNRLCARAALHDLRRCRSGDPSRLCRGPEPGRRGAGHRLGAQRGIHLRRGRPHAECRLPRTTACRWRPTCR